MSAVPASHPQRLVLYDVPWERYSRLLRAFDDRHLRLTYDQGSLEIRTLSHKHEGYSYLMGRFVDVLTEECELPVKAGRSTTFRRRKEEKGLEPDNCYWIATESRVRGKDRINLSVDPPPDLALETDIMHSSLDRLSIYAALRVPEVWRLTAKKLTFLVLSSRGKYSSVAQSGIFPFLGPDDVFRFLQMRSTEDENAVVRAFRAWVRKQLKSAD
jgi:Uma2 family endonuclease